MGRIQSNIGLVSGVDIKSTVDQLMAIESQPRDTLVARNKSLQSEQAALGELTALVIAVQIGSDRLKTNDNFRTLSATSSDPATLAVKASNNATAGQYSFSTVQTAQSAALTSNAFVSADQTFDAGELVIRTGGFLDTTTNLEDLRGGAGISSGKIQITDRSGAARTIDLRFATTIDGVLKAINTTSGLHVTASTDGDRIVLTDTSGQTTSNLIVEEVGAGRTAADLGLAGIDVASQQATGEDLVTIGRATRLSSLLDGRGIRFGRDKDIEVKLSDGTSFAIDLNKSSEPTTVGQLLDLINAKDPLKLKAQISSDGSTLELIDLTSGSNTFRVSSPTGNLAQQLGWDSTAENGTITGQRLQSGLSGPLLSSLFGGEGLSELGSIDITNQNGDQATIDLSAAKTLRDVIQAINAAGIQVTASLNSDRTGIVLQDSSGGTSSHLIIADHDATDTATKLQIAADTTNTSIDSGSLDLQFVHENTLLSSLHHGTGVRAGTFKITNAAGKAGTVNLVTLKAKTLGDVIEAINKLNLNVDAKLNEQGDGFVLIDRSSGSGKLTVEDVGSSKAAADLGIAGSAESLTVDGTTKLAIKSSQNYRLDVAKDTKLSDLVNQINSGDGPVTASLLNTGPNSVRLLLASKQSGQAGRIVADGTDLGTSFSVTAQGRDAILSVGASDDSGGTLLRSSSNTFDNVLSGLTLTLSGISSQPINVTVTETTDTAEKNLRTFVDQYNKVIDKLKTLTSFDANSNTAGLLFGSSEALRVEFSMSRLITTRFTGAGNIRSTEQIGLSLDTQGKLSFDAEKFRAQVAKDPEAVKEFFTTETSGFSARSKQVLDTLAGAKSSVLINANNSIQAKVLTNTKRIDAMNARLEKSRTRLLTQFYNMETAIAKLKNNLDSIGSIQNLSGAFLSS